MRTLRVLRSPIIIVISQRARTSRSLNCCRLIMTSSTTPDSITADSSDANDTSGSPPTLSFPFRGRNVPVTYAASVPLEHARLAMESSIFQIWYRNCELSSSSSSHGDSGTDDQDNNKRIEIHGVEIQSVDMFGARCVSLSYRDVKYVGIRARAAINMLAFLLIFLTHFISWPHCAHYYSAEALVLYPKTGASFRA